ncbi:Protein similar to CwfJ C-terminus 2 [Nesidiocoris tenuis]|uniref:Protein similar to CwfJ C-terminus 2 n=1 Tax=Nesidiocoris tenuis TaxID=355587 RepID=A0ABN7AC48_9HEMI|nr:Protein similar to CwfJ C-terminus 2 [Nesidiocoris tenuis]
MGKDKKKHKKEKKHRKHKKDKKRSSSVSSDSDGEWVEKGAEGTSGPKSIPSLDEKDNPAVTCQPKEEDAWSSIFAGTSTSEIRKAKEAEKVVERVSLEAKPGQSSRELNPYWKDGGTGLPPERVEKKTALFRRPDDESSRHMNSDRSQQDSRSRFQRPKEDNFEYNRRNAESDRRQYHRSKDGGRGDHRSNDRSSSRFMKPREDSNDSGHRSRHQSSGGWRKAPLNSDKNEGSHSEERKKETDKSVEEKRKSSSDKPLRSDNSSGNDQDRDSEHCLLESKEPKNPPKSSPSTEEPKILTSDEMNALNAKIFRAEMAGKMELVAKLKAQLENSRAVEVEKTVILTQTDAKGFTRPVSRDDRGSSKNKRKVQTHENSKRVRYFADDDDHSLQDMYEKEKYSSAMDQEADFMNLMGKEMSRKDGSLALDDPFEETASIDDRNKRDKQQWDRAVREQAKKEKVYDECKWCFGAKRMNQNLVVRSKDKAYVACPPFQSLTEGHCIILPHSHVSCSTQLDEDVWDEIMDLRKDLVRRLEANDEDCVFFETASYLHKFPHMMIHCVPLPREIGDMAPIYFKKALLECESEWSNNKKVVDLAGRGLRKSVPKGLPYFFVDFGDQSGFAHVIEDQKLFPTNFAQEIVGGMLDLNHELWRKQRNISEEDVAKNLEYLQNLMKDD